MSGTELTPMTGSAATASPIRPMGQHPQSSPHGTSRPIHNSPEQEGLLPPPNPVQNLNHPYSSSLPYQPYNPASSPHNASIGDLSLIQLWQQHKFLILLVFGSLIIFFLFFATSSRPHSHSDMELRDFRSWRKMSHTHDVDHDEEEDHVDYSHHGARRGTGHRDRRDAEEREAREALKTFIKVHAGMPLDDVHFPAKERLALKRKYDQYLHLQAAKHELERQRKRERERDHRHHKSNKHDHDHGEPDEDDNVNDLLRELHEPDVHQDLTQDLLKLQRLMNDKNRDSPNPTPPAVPAGTIEIVFPDEHSSKAETHSGVSEPSSEIIPFDSHPSRPDFQKPQRGDLDEHHQDRSRSTNGNDQRTKIHEAEDEDEGEFIIHHPQNTLENLAASAPRQEVSPIYDDEQLARDMERLLPGVMNSLDEEGGEPVVNMASRHAPVTHHRGEPLSEPGLSQPKSPSHPDVRQHIDAEVAPSTTEVSTTISPLNVIPPVISPVLYPLNFPPAESPAQIPMNQPRTMRRTPPPIIPPPSTLPTAADTPPMITPPLPTRPSIAAPTIPTEEVSHPTPPMIIQPVESTSPMPRAPVTSEPIPENQPQPSPIRSAQPDIEPIAPEPMETHPPKAIHATSTSRTSIN